MAEGADALRAADNRVRALVRDVAATLEVGPGSHWGEAAATLWRGAAKMAGSPASLEAKKKATKPAAGGTVSAKAL